MNSTSNSFLGMRLVRISIACLVVLLVGESAASAYQYPTKPKHRQFRIFVAAQKVAKTKSTKIVKSTGAKQVLSAKSLVMQDLVNTKSLTLNPIQKLNFANEDTRTVVTVTITSNISPTTAVAGSAELPGVGGYSILPVGTTFSTTPTCSFFTAAGVQSTLNSATPAGDYLVRCSGAVVSNTVEDIPGIDSVYNISYVDVPFTLTTPPPPAPKGEPTPITISPTVTPSSSSIVFGQAAPSISFTATPSGHLSTSPSCGLFSGNTPVVVSPIPAGNYVAHCTHDAVASSDDYSITYGSDVAFTVTKAPITVTASSGTITAGSGFYPSVSVTAGSLVSPDALGIATYTYSSSPTVPTTAGTYSVTPTSVSFTSGNANNYAITFAAGSLRVNDIERPSVCVINCGPYIPPVVITKPTLPEVALPIITIVKPKIKKVLPQRFSRQAMLSTRVANFVVITAQTGKKSSIAIPHDADTKIRLTDGVQASLSSRLKLVVTDTGLDITSINGWTGRISVPVVSTVDGKLVERFIGIIEVPGPVLNPQFYLADINSATISWKSDGSQVVFYHVYQGSDLICSTPKTTCTQVKSVNTHAILKIEAIGHESTYSSSVSAAYAKNKLVQAEVVHFASGAYTLQADDKSTLDQFIHDAKSLGLNVIEIIGHTDSAGSFMQNKILSLARANAVRAYIAKSFPTVKFVLKGVASAEPLKNNTSAAGRENNRRAEVFIG